MPAQPLQLSLLAGELINPDPAPSVAPPPAPDADINERYVSAEVRIVVEQARYPLKQIPEIVQSADYNLQPDFQRRPRWSRDKQSRLIESLIMNVPVPPIFLYEAELGRYEVMDGRQRLTAIRDYYADAFALEGLTEWPELNGRKYSELPEQVRRGIDRRFLSAILLLHETAKSNEQAVRLKQLVFERINTGGEDLSNQEKRNALFPGPMNNLCIKLARTPSLCEMWSIPSPTATEDPLKPDWVPPPDLQENELYSTMGDAELVLRFFAHRQRHTLWRGGTRLDEYHTAYLRKANGFPDTLLQPLGDLFVRTCDLVYAVLGQEAFSLYRRRKDQYSWVRRPALIAYDPIMAAFSALLDHEQQLRAASPRIQSGLDRFYEDNADVFDGRRTNPADIKRRDDVFYDFLKTHV